MDFTLPELGEQIESGDVLRVLVKAGDAIAKEQPVLELETDKATIEVPSSVAGTVKDIKVKAGDKVKVGQAIFSYDGAAGGAGADVAPKAAGKAEAPAKADANAVPGKPEASPKAAEPARAGAEKVEDTEEGQPDVEVQDRSTKPDKAGVKDPSIGPQAAADRGANVVDITRGARPAAPRWRFPTLPAGAASSGSRCARSVARRPSI